MAYEAMIVAAEAKWKRQCMSTAVVMAAAAFGIWRTWQTRAARGDIRGWVGFFVLLMVLSAWRAWSAYSDLQKAKQAVGSL